MPVGLNSILQIAEAGSFQRGARGRAYAQFDALVLVNLRQRRQRARSHIARHEQRLHRVARRIALRLGVVAYAHGLFDVGVGVDVDVANAIQVLDHRHPGFFDQARDQALATARHDHIDILRHGDELADRRAVCGGHHLHGVGRQASIGQTFLDERGQRAVRFDRLGAAAQNGRVARLDAKRRGIHRHVRTRLIDDADHAQRHTHLADLDAGRAELHVADLADGVRQRGDLLQASGHGIDGAVGEREAVDEGSILAVSAGALDVAGVDLFELGSIATDGGCNMQQRAVLLRGAGTCHAARGGARLTADQGHVFVHVELLHDDRDRRAAGNSE